MRRFEYGCHDGAGPSQLETSNESMRNQVESIAHADKFQEHST